MSAVDNVPIICHWFVGIGGKFQFASGVIETGGNLPPVLFTPVANFFLPLVSTTPAVPVAKFAAGVVDTWCTVTVSFFKKFEMTQKIF
jgi:hypothetical protein